MLNKTDVTNVTNVQAFVGAGLRVTSGKKHDVTDVTKTAASPKTSRLSRVDLIREKA